MTEDRIKPVTLRSIRRMVERGERFSMLTCYDATTAAWLSDAGVHMLLVGDSAAQMILGYDTTIHAPLDFMLAITAAVKRGAPRCLVMGDMPFMSYQVSDEQAIRNAGRFMTEGQADLVKVEVDGTYGDLVGKLSRAGVPVVAHLGWQPQRKPLSGVRTAVVAGRTAAEVRELVAQADLMEQRGAVMVLLEQCTAEVAERVTQRLSIPVVGCGAGPACHGHVVVLQDLLGMTEWRPSFAPALAELGPLTRQACEQWVRMIRDGSYPGEHPYEMADGEAERLARE